MPERLEKGLRAVPRSVACALPSSWLVYYISMYTYIYAYTYIYIYMHIYIFVYIHTDSYRYSAYTQEATLKQSMGFVCRILACLMI